MNKTLNVHKGPRLLIVIGIALVLAISVLLSYGKTAGAATATPQPKVVTVTTTFKTYCLNNSAYDVWAVVSGMSTDPSIEYIGLINTPDSGMVQVGYFNAVPFGTTITEPVYTVGPGTYTYSGVINDSQGNSYPIPAQTITVPNCSHPNSPYVGMAPTPDGNGYWAVTAKGNV